MSFMVQLTGSKTIGVLLGVLHQRHNLINCWRIKIKPSKNWICGFIQNCPITHLNQVVHTTIKHFNIQPTIKTKQNNFLGFDLNLLHFIISVKQVTSSIPLKTGLQSGYNCADKNRSIGWSQITHTLYLCHRTIQVGVQNCSNTTMCCLNQ